MTMDRAVWYGCRQLTATDGDNIARELAHLRRGAALLPLTIGASFLTDALVSKTDAGCIH